MFPLTSKSIVEARVVSGAGKGILCDARERFIEVRDESLLICTNLYVHIYMHNAPNLQQMLHLHSIFVDSKPLSRARLADSLLNLQSEIENHKSHL